MISKFGDIKKRKGMKIIKKYVPCRIGYLLKLYAFMVAVVCLLALMKSCPGRPFGEAFGKAIAGPTIAFFIVSPVFGLIFTEKSVNSCRFHLPFQYIKEVRVDKYRQKLTITYNYNVCLCRKSQKDYKYEISVSDYKTTLAELIKCFPKDVVVIYD